MDELNIKDTLLSNLYRDYVGKSYAARLPEVKRPEGDFYETPLSLIWVIRDIILQEFDKKMGILEPCSGIGGLAEQIQEMGFEVFTNDLYSGLAQSRHDYIKDDYFSVFNQIITNFPFSKWDDCVIKAKKHCSKILTIGRMNYFGTYNRSHNGIWDNLKAVYVFNRYVDYRTPHRSDGLFYTGAMCTGWFLWDRQYKGDTIIKTVDVQKYAKLGTYK